MNKDGDKRLITLLSVSRHCKPLSKPFFFDFFQPDIMPINNQFLKLCSDYAEYLVHNVRYSIRRQLTFVNISEERKKFYSDFLA